MWVCNFSYLRLVEAENWSLKFGGKVRGQGEVEGVDIEGYKWCVGYQGLVGVDEGDEAGEGGVESEIGCKVLGRVDWGDKDVRVYEGDSI